MRYGLMGAGPVSKSLLARLPRLAAELGPVAAPSFRLASRIVNSLKAGTPARHLSEFRHCGLILLCVPADTLEAAVSELAAAELDWSGKVLLLCGSSRDSRVLTPVRERGAAAGSLGAMDGLAGWFIIEGDRLALRAAKRLVHELHGRPIVLDTARVPLYSAGLSFASGLFTPLLASAIRCIAAGAGDAAAVNIARALFERSLRTWLHSGRKSWSGPVASGDEAAVMRELAALEKASPRMARYYREMAAFALEEFNRHPALLRNLRNRAIAARQGS